jgi:hypothetical protein
MPLLADGLHLARNPTRHGHSCCVVVGFKTQWLFRTDPDLGRLTWRSQDGHDATGLCLDCPCCMVLRRIVLFRSHDESLVNTLADQSKELKIQLGPQRKPSERTGPESRVDRNRKLLETLSLKLPNFGTVARTIEDRGFGFLAAVGRKDVFFHVRGAPESLTEVRASSLSSISNASNVTLAGMAWASSC